MAGSRTITKTRRSNIRKRKTDEERPPSKRRWRKQRACDGKIRYRKWEKAAEAAKSYNRRVPVRYGVMKPYRCRWCRYNHKGHSYRR